METPETNKKFIIVALVVLVLIIGGTLGWQYYEKVKTSSNAGSVNGQNTVSEEPIQTITAKHQFKNGKHIIAGEVNLPTPCHLLVWNVRVEKSLPEQVTTAFNSSSQADTCAQVITSARFKIEFNASENAIIRASWNDKPTTLNLVPVSAGENIENFEVFIKG